MLRKEKKCKNPECEELIESFQNPKKLFCNNSCKNHFHYIVNKEENYEFELHEKELKTNYTIIIHFLNKSVFKIKDDVAKSLGFKTNVFMSIECLAKGEK